MTKSLSVEYPGRARTRSARAWLRIPAVLAPVVLTAGWMLAAAVQPGHFSSINSTISDLAATYAHHRAVMTTALVATGGCLLLLSIGSNRSSVGSRIVLAVSALAIFVVAAAPLPGHGQLHSAAAFLAFGCLTVWPLAGFRVGDTPAVRSILAVLVTAVNLVFFLWLVFAPGLYVGFAERSLATVALLWIAIQTFVGTPGGRG